MLCIFGVGISSFDSSATLSSIGQSADCVRPVLYDVVNTDVCSHSSISRRGGGFLIQRRKASFSASRNTHLIQHRQAVNKPSPGDSVRPTLCAFDGGASTAVYTKNPD